MVNTAVVVDERKLAWSEFAPQLELEGRRQSAPKSGSSAPNSPSGVGTIDNRGLYKMIPKIPSGDFPEK